MALLGRTRTGRRSTIVLIVALLMMFGVVAAAGAAPAPKVDVCHQTSGAPGYILINVSDNAFDAHIAHGDAAPGEAVPGRPGSYFGADCSVMLYAYGDVIWTSQPGRPDIPYGVRDV